VKTVAYGTDCGMFPFSRGILEFQAMVGAGLTSLRASKAATSVAASLLQRDDIGELAVGKQADIVAVEVILSPTSALPSGSISS
jgi:imidazolonepropionase-like amidohydrolase